MYKHNGNNPDIALALKDIWTFKSLPRFRATTTVHPPRGEGVMRTGSVHFTYSKPFWSTMDGFDALFAACPRDSTNATFVSEVTTVLRRVRE